MRATASSHLVTNTTKCVVTSPLHWFAEIFNEKSGCIFKEENRFRRFGL